MADAPRDPSLPEGISNLVDLIKQQEQADKAFQKIEGDIRNYGKRLAPLIFEMLYRRIDHDLLFTTEPDLVMPKIQEASREVFNTVAPGSWKDDKTAYWIADIVTEEAWLYICCRRPRQT